MVDVLEAGLIVGALALDVYAYKKMKDAEAAAEDAVRNRERDRFKASASNVQVDVHPQADAAPDTDHAQTSLPDHTQEETITTHTEWKPVTYESVAPVIHTQETTDEETAPDDSDHADEIRTQYRTISERLDVIDERLGEQDTKLSVIETKYDHLDTESQANSATLRTMNEQLQHIEIPQDQVEQIVNVKFQKSNERLAGSVKEQAKKLADIEAKLDSHLIAAADPVLIKRDLRDEFYPLLKAPQSALDTHEKENKANFAALSKRITAARDAAMVEAKTKASKAEVRRLVATIQSRPAARKTAKTTTATAKKTAPKATAKVLTKTVKKTTTVRKAAKAKPAAKPKSKIQSAVHEYAKSRKAKKTGGKAGAGNEVTVTTSVPKGVNVSTEVVTGGKGQ